MNTPERVDLGAGVYSAQASSASEVGEFFSSDSMNSEPKKTNAAHVRSATESTDFSSDGLLSDYEVISNQHLDAIEGFKTFTQDDIQLAASLSQSTYRGSNFVIKDGIDEMSFNVKNKDSFGFGVKPDDFHDERLDFKAKLFWDKNEHRLILAFKGSDSVKHAKVCVNQFLTGSSAYYQMGMALARTISVIAKQNNLGMIYTGHSLGGGVACACSQVTGQCAITFNAASVEKDTITNFTKTYGGEQSSPNHLVLAIKIRGEILSKFLEFIGHYAGGTALELDKSGKGSVKDHSIATVREKLKK